MPFRDYANAISTPWLRKKVGGGLLYAKGLILDALTDWLSIGVKARFPDQAPPDALGFIGNDRQIDRGPAEPDSGYKTRLRRASDTWRNAGGGRTILTQLAAYFTGIAQPPLRLVSDSSVWHVYDWATGLVARSKPSPANWIWDSLTGVRWWRGWVIIDSSSGPWTRHKWGSGGKWGSSGTTWGSSATKQEVISIARIINKWKPAHVATSFPATDAPQGVVWVVVCFSSTLFRSTDTAPPNPNGNYDVAANRDPNATYWPIRVT